MILVRQRTILVLIPLLSGQDPVPWSILLRRIHRQSIRQSVLAMQQQAAHYPEVSAQHCIRSRKQARDAKLWFLCSHRQSGITVLWSYPHSMVMSIRRHVAMPYRRSLIPSSVQTANGFSWVFLNRTDITMIWWKNALTDQIWRMILVLHRQPTAKPMQKHWLQLFLKNLRNILRMRW